MFPIIFARDIPNTAAGFNTSVSRYHQYIYFSCRFSLLFIYFINFIFRFSEKDSVDEHAVKGKIVLCKGIQSPTDVGFFSGAAGVIFGDVSAKDSPNTYALPATFLSLGNLIEIQYYMESTRYRFIYHIY